MARHVICNECGEAVAIDPRFDLDAALRGSGAWWLAEQLDGAVPHAAHPDPAVQASLTAFRVWLWPVIAAHPGHGWRVGKPARSARVVSPPDVVPEPPAGPPSLPSPEELARLGLRARIGRAAAIGQAALEAGLATDGSGVRSVAATLYAHLPDPAAALRAEAALLDLAAQDGAGTAAEEALGALLRRAPLAAAEREARLAALAVRAFTREAAAGRTTRAYDGGASAQERERLRAAAVGELAVRGQLLRAISLAVEWKLDIQSEARRALAGAAVAALADPGRPAGERGRLLREVARSLPEVRGELRTGGVLPPAELPAEIDAWYRIPDEAKPLVALSIPLAGVVRALDDGTAEQAEVAVAVAVQVLALDGSTAQALEPALRRRLPDCRIPRHERGVGGQPVGIPAQHCHARALELLPKRVARPLLRDAIEVVLDRATDPSGSWVYVGRVAGSLSVPPEKVLEQLCRGLADARKSPRARIARRHAVEMLVQNHPAARTAAEALRDRANLVLVSILRDPASPAELRSLVAEGLPAWAPREVEGLRAQKLLPGQPVPAWTSRLHPEAELRRLSSEVDLDEVLQLLESGQEPARVLTAIRLAVPLATWSPGAATSLEPRLRARFDDPTVAQGTPQDLGIEAVRAWVALVGKLSAQQRPDRGGVEEALRAVLRRAPTSSHYAELGRFPARAVAAAARQLHPGELEPLADLLLAALADRGRPAFARLQARMALEPLGLPGRLEEADRLLLSVLAEREEDPELRMEAHVLLAPRLVHEVLELQRSGVLPSREVPRAGELCFPVPGGHDVSRERVEISAHTTLPEEVLSVLERREDLARACGAALLAGKLTERVPALEQRIEAALLAALTEPGIVEDAVGGVRARFSLGDLAGEAHRELSRRRRGPAAREALLAGLQQAVRTGVGSSLELLRDVLALPPREYVARMTGHGCFRARAYVNAFTPGDAASLGEALASIVEDGARPIEERLGAFDALSWAAAQLRSDPLAARRERALATLR